MYMYEQVYNYMLVYNYITDLLSPTSPLHLPPPPSHPPHTFTLSSSLFPPSPPPPIPFSLITFPHAHAQLRNKSQCGTFH